MKFPSLLILAGCIVPVFIHHAMAEPEFGLSTGAWASRQFNSSLWATPDDLDWRAVLRTHLDDASSSVPVVMSLGQSIVIMIPEEVGHVLETTSSSKLLPFLSALSNEQGQLHPQSSWQVYALRYWTLIASRHLRGTRDGVPEYIRTLGYVTSRDGE